MSARKSLRARILDLDALLATLVHLAVMAVTEMAIKATSTTTTPVLMGRNLTTGLLSLARANSAGRR